MKIKLRAATSDDSRFLWSLRNAPFVRKQSTSQRRIPWKQHRAWFPSALRDYDFRIIIADNKYCGYIRVSKVSGEVSIALDKRYRGKGIGTYAINHMPAAKLATIRVNNVPSIKAFENAGFKPCFVVMEKE